MGRHSRPDGQHHRAHSGPHLVPVPAPVEGRHRAGNEYQSGGNGGSTEGRWPSSESQYPSYEGRHLGSDGQYPGYVGRHRARHAAAEQSTGSWVNDSYHSARRAVVATTIATTLTAGGVVGLLLHGHGAAQQASNKADAPRPVTRLADVRGRISPAANVGSMAGSRALLARDPIAADGSSAPAATGRAHLAASRTAAGRTVGRSAAGRKTINRGVTRAPHLRTAPSAATKSAATSPAKSAVGRPAAGRAATPAIAGRWVRPGTGAISSCFCQRWGTFHWGVDLAAPYGAPIYAAGDGVVLRAGPATGFGQAVYIQHANGDTTVYGHMEKILVTPGERVRAGKLIALVGAEGEATGPHLHFEVHKGSEYGEKIDPVPWLKARGVQL